MAKEIEYKDPVVDWETRAYWEGCARHELVLQRCGSCGLVQHRPRAVCAACLSVGFESGFENGVENGIEHFVASGLGEVHSYTIIHQNQIPSFAGAVPYVLAYVDLPEGPRLLTNIVGCESDEVSIGMAVKVEFVDTGEFAIPRFKPA